MIREKLPHMFVFRTLGIGSLLAFILSASPLTAADKLNVGLSASLTRIEATAISGASDSSPMVLLVGGLQGKDETAGVVIQEAEAYERLPQDRRPFRLVAVPLANPDGSALQFPPAGIAYRENVESNVLWRWVGIHAPDLVVIVGTADFGLAEALSQNTVAGVGRIPARRVAAASGIVQSLPSAIPKSEARSEIERRRSRSPRELAEELAQFYGRDLNQPTYIPAMALIGLLRLGRTADVVRLATPYLDGTQDSLARPSQGALAGHMLFFELAKRTGDER
jgi:hypothetical protein